MIAWNVYVKGKVIDTIHYDGVDKNEVRSSLIHHDGYPENIVVRKAHTKKRIKKDKDTSNNITE